MAFENFPLELTKRKQWVGWRYFQRKGQEKLSKLPVDPSNGGPAKSDDSTTWDTFAAALESVEKYKLDGIGIMFADGIFGVDIDHCINPDTGKLDDYAAEIIDTVRSYTEKSPSGTGIHILCKGELPPGARRKGPVEMYSSGRFFTVTGESYGEKYPFSDCTERIKAMHAKYLAGADKSAEKAADLPQERTRAIANIPGPMTNEDILQRAFASKGGEKFKDFYDGNWKKYSIGDGSQSAADQAFCNLLAFWFGCDIARMDEVFRRSGMYRPKWDERRGGQTYGQKTLESAVQDCKEVYNPQRHANGHGSGAVRVTSAGHFSAAAPPAPRTPPKIGGAPLIATPQDKATACKPLSYSWDDTGNARRLRAYCLGELRYNITDGKWMYWDGRRWAKDEMVEIKRKADAMLDQMREAIKDDAEIENISTYRKHLQKTRSSRSKESMIKECRHLPDIPLASTELDKPGNVLNSLSGMVNLRTGNVIAHDPAVLLSKIVATVYDPTAGCPHWEKFLDDVTQSDDELKLYLQRMAGYCLTASTREQCVFFLYGNGSNGKSTFVDTLARIMGEYSANCQPETVMMRDRTGNARSDIARLRGIRMVTTSEPNEGSRLDEGTVKQMTGGTENKLTARFLYGEEFEFVPEFKVVMSTNYKPIIKGTDNGIWRRVRLIPFSAQISDDKKDKNLPHKLEKEFPGILNWAVRGAVDWYREGMPKCAVVEGASIEYRAEMDTIQQFCDDCIEESSTRSVQSSRLYTCYKNWSADRGDRYPVSANKFYAEMKKRFKMRKTSTFNEYVGIYFTERGVRFSDDFSGGYKR